MVRLLLQLNSNQINWFDSTLTPAQGGLGKPDLTTEAPQQYSASKFFTEHHVESIKFQSEITNINEQLVGKLKRDLRTLKANNTKSKIESIDHPSTLNCCVSHGKPETKVQVPGSTPCSSKTRVWHWISNNLGTSYISCDCSTIYHCRIYRLPVLVEINWT